MYIGFLTGCLGAMPLKEKAKYAAERGFKALEISCWPKVNDRDYSASDIDVANLTQKEADEIKAYMEEYGLTISSLAYYDNNLSADPEFRKKVNNHVLKCIDAAVMLGVPAVGTFVGKNHLKSMEENFDEFEQVFSKLVGYAEKRGIKLMIENCPMTGWQVRGLPGTISYSPELWAEMFRRVPNKNFGLNYDPSHPYILLIDYLEPIKQFKDRIFHVHAKDAVVNEDKLKVYGIFNKQLNATPGKGIWDFKMPGLGKVDFKALVKELEDIGYNGVISIEHEDPDYEGSEAKVKAGLEVAYKYLSDFVR